MALNYQKLQITDFSGGLTDRVVGSSIGTFSNINCFTVDNMKKLTTAYGFRCLTDNSLGTVSRIKHIAKIGSRYVALSANKAYEVKPETEESIAFKTFPEVIPDNRYVYSSEWKDQLIYGLTPFKKNSTYDSVYRIYSRDYNGVPTFTSYKAGVPDFHGAKIDGGSGSNLYRYKILYVLTYTTSEGVTYEEFGRPQYFAHSRNDLIGDGSSVTISGLDQLLPTSGYDADNTSIRIYRTKANLENYYLLSEYLQEATYTDSETDDSLNGNSSYYSNNGIEWGNPPKCGCMKIIGNTGFYGDIWDGDSHKPYRVLQSIAGIPTGVNYTFYDDMENRIIGIGAVGSTPIIFTTKEIYRLDGQIAADGSGSFRKRVISTSAGCVSHNSIAETGSLIYFAGNDGFYVTDGYKVSNITVTPKYDLLETYRSIIADDKVLDDDQNPVNDIDNIRLRISHTLDTANTRIKWLVTNNSDTANNTIFIYDVNNQCFTTETCDKATYNSAVEYGRGFLRGDDSGNIYIHSTDYTDGVIPQNNPKESWEFTSLPLSIKTSGTDFGSTNVKKWVNNLSLTIENRGKMSFSLKSFNEGSGYGTDMSSVELTDSISWRDPSVLWRQVSIGWRPKPVKHIKRRFPRTHLRCRSKQIELSPSEIEIYSHTEYGAIKIEPLETGSIGYYTATLLDSDESATPERYNWPKDIVGYKISLSGDGYATEHRITAFSESEHKIVFIGGTSVHTADGQEYKVVGELKRQAFTIDSMVLNYAFMQDVGAEDIGKK